MCSKKSIRDYSIIVFWNISTNIRYCMDCNLNFGKKHSTELALIFQIEKIISAIERNVRKPTQIRARMWYISQSSWPQDPLLRPDENYADETSTAPVLPFIVLNQWGGIQTSGRDISGVQLWGNIMPLVTLGTLMDSCHPVGNKHLESCPLILDATKNRSTVRPVLTDRGRVSSPRSCVSTLAVTIAAGNSNLDIVNCLSGATWALAKTKVHWTSSLQLRRRKYETHSYPAWLTSAKWWRVADFNSPKPAGETHLSMVKLPRTGKSCSHNRHLSYISADTSTSQPDFN